MFKNLLVVSFLLLNLMQSTNAQSFSFHLEAFNIEELGGVQSFAFGQHNGKWLIVGGRVDGLHRRQPWASFDIAGLNNQIMVIDPNQELKWTIPVSELSPPLAEQLSSTNMEFYQDGDILYCLGGYGYSPSLEDHTTYNLLTAIDVPGLIDAVVSGKSIQGFIRFIQDDAFQVTGGKLEKMDGIYHLLGGQKFIGRYNPMGPDHGPGFIQEYSNSIRRFMIQDDGNTIDIVHLDGFQDSINLHRRDYNAVPQIMPDLKEGITMFSGVFQNDIDLPFLNSVDVNNESYIVNNDFQQLFNHYHCPVIPLYSERDNEMHTVFFGGIAQFYIENDMVVQDDNVPFVKTISRLTRDANGVMMEKVLDIEMPSLLGAGAEFIPLEGIPHYSNGVFQLDNIDADTTLVGYIFGGIESSQANIFFINDGQQSTANETLFKVYLIKEYSSNSTYHVDVSKSFNLKIFPNPNNGLFVVEFTLDKTSDVLLTLMDQNGKNIVEKSISNFPTGIIKLGLDARNIEWGGIYLLKLKTSYAEIVRKVIIQQ